MDVGCWMLDVGWRKGDVGLRKNCVLKGDISYRKLHIEDGAQFEGQCDLVGSINTENVNA